MASLEVRPARPEDEPAIARILDEVFGERSMEKRRRLWRWRVDDNPAATDDFPGFLVALAEGEVVGVHGLFPLRLKVDDRVVTASCSSDLAVRPEVRGAGMRIKLAAMDPEIAPVHLSTSANRSANTITLALGGAEIPGGRTCRMIRPVRAGGLVERAVARRASWAAPMIRGAVDVADRAAYSLRQRRARSRKEGDFDIEEIEEFDARFDGLWAECQEQERVSLVKDRAYLAWRYARYPFGGPRVIAAVGGDGGLGGVAAWQTADDEDGLRFTALLDLLTPTAEVETRRSLLREVLLRADQEGAQYVTALALDAPTRELLSGMGFIERSGEFSRLTVQSHLEDMDLASRDWTMALGDGDGFFLDS